MASKKVSIKALCEQWMAAKLAEQSANAERVRIEGMLLANGIEAKEEGSMTVKRDGFKITTTGNMRYGIDNREMFDALVQQLPGDLQPLKTVLDDTGAKWLRANRADLWAMIAPSIKITPGKVGVKVEENGE